MLRVWQHYLGFLSLSHNKGSTVVWTVPQRTTIDATPLLSLKLICEVKLNREMKIFLQIVDIIFWTLTLDKFICFDSKKWLETWQGGCIKSGSNGVQSRQLVTHYCVTAKTVSENIGWALSILVKDFSCIFPPMPSLSHMGILPHPTWEFCVNHQSHLFFWSSSPQILNIVTRVEIC